jgi:hypothetical protein
VTRRRTILPLQRGLEDSDAVRAAGTEHFRKESDAMSLLTLELASDFSTRMIAPVRGGERRPLPRRLARSEGPLPQLFSLDMILSRRPERQEEDGERWDGLA